MVKEIKQYIETCDVCQRIGKPKKNTTVIPIKVTGPFEQIGIDFIGPLKYSSKEYFFESNFHLFLKIQYLKS